MAITRVKYGNITAEVVQKNYIRPMMHIASTVLIAAMANEAIVLNKKPVMRKAITKEEKERRYAELDMRCNTREYGMYIASTTAIKEAYLESKGYY